MQRTITIAWSSVGIACAVLGLKGAAWWITGSAALYADALESVVNVAAAVVALLALRLSAVPADANHPYGHAKAEFFAAVVEGVMIVLAALAILWAAWDAWLAPRAPEHPALGLAVNALATTINAAWATFLLRYASRTRSPALLADARHLFADVVTSLGVLVGVGLVATTGMLWLDPALAALTALNILWSGARVIRESVGGLMDEALPETDLSTIRALVSQHAEGAIEAHDLRSRRAGRHTFLEFHLVVPGEMTVDHAHRICDRVEAALKAEIEGLVITIHVEPDGKAKHSGIVVLGVALALLLAFPAAAKPQRIVSLNLCADQFVVALAEPAHIAALSPLAADPALSAVAAQAARIPRVRPNAEAVLALTPDLAIAGAWGARAAEHLLRARGVAVLRLDLAEDFPAIRAQILRLGEALGEAARAAVLAAELDAALAAIEPKPRGPALLWQAAGFTPGQGTLADAVLRAAGHTNAAPFRGYGTLRLEALLARKPALLVLPARVQGGPSLSETLLSHPALAGLPTRRIEPAWLACGGPATVRAVAALAR
jgi:cation diffusion facilitator family transporter